MSEADLSNWRLSPFSRWAFHNVEKIIPVATVKAGGDPIASGVYTIDFTVGIDLAKLGYGQQGTNTVGSTVVVRRPAKIVINKTWAGENINRGAGAAFSLAPVRSQSALLRPPNRDARLRNFYLVGAGTHPGAGVPAVVASARATARLMLEDLK